MMESNGTQNWRGIDWMPPLRRITVSKVFWSLVQKHFPGLSKHPGYLLLFWYLLFGSWRDEKSRRLLLSSEIISMIEGRSPNNSQAEAFLRAFVRDVLPRGTRFYWTGYDPRKGKCRQLLCFDLGPFEEMRQLEYEQCWHKEGRVYLDGTPYTIPKARELRRKEQAEAQAQEILCSDAEKIRDYMNSLAPNLFSRAVGQNYSRALAVAQTLKTPAARDQQISILKEIESQPQPFYFPSDKKNTVRLFTRQSIPNLQRDVRKALTEGWSDADLRCSQLAICAWMWKVEEVQAFLATGDNFWEYALELMEVPQGDRAAVKPCIKGCVYSICFGMEARWLKGSTARLLKGGGQNPAYASRFLEVPLVQAMLLARESAMMEICERGGAETCYGKRCEVREDRHARGIMAELAQAWEMKLILPAFEVAHSTDDFKITLFQYDGFSVAFRRRAPLWKERISAAVNEEIARHGIQTSLEWK